MNQGTDLISYWGIKKKDFDWEKLGLEYFMPYLTDYRFNHNPDMMKNNFVEFTIPVEAIELEPSEKMFNEAKVFSTISIDTLYFNQGIGLLFDNKIPIVTGYKIKLFFK